FRDLDGRVEVAGVLVGDADDTVDQLAVDPGTQFDRCAVRANDDRVAVRDAAARGVGGRELDVASRPLEAELGDALDRRSGEERRVAMETQGPRLVDLVRSGGGRRRNVVVASRKRR